MKFNKLNIFYLSSLKKFGVITLKFNWFFFYPAVVIDPFDRYHRGQWQQLGIFTGYFNLFNSQSDFAVLVDMEDTYLDGDGENRVYSDVSDHKCWPVIWRGWNDVKDSDKWN